MAIEVRRRLVPADIERMIACGELSQDEFWEFANGEIVWLAPAHYPQPVICTLISAELVPFGKRIGALVFDSNGGFMVGQHNQQLRAPDVSLVTRERLNMIRRGGFQTAAPDLAVEVLSDDQLGRAYKHTKIAEYFAAGARVVWFVDYRTQSVSVYEPGRAEITTYSASEDITLDQIAPGFSCRVSAFFPE